jgi:hypothetical protein
MDTPASCPITAETPHQPTGVLQAFICCLPTCRDVMYRPVAFACTHRACSVHDLATCPVCNSLVHPMTEDLVLIESVASFPRKYSAQGQSARMVPSSQRSAVICTDDAGSESTDSETASVTASAAAAASYVCAVCTGIASAAAAAVDMDPAAASAGGESPQQHVPPAHPFRELIARVCKVLGHGMPPSSGLEQQWDDEGYAELRWPVSRREWNCLPEVRSEAETHGLHADPSGPTLLIYRPVRAAEIGGMRGGGGKAVKIGPSVHSTRRTHRTSCHR